MIEYYIIDRQGNQVGPVTEILFSSYGVDANTLVWREGLNEWKRASELAELRHLFGPTLGQQPPAPPVNPEPPMTPPPVTPPDAPAWGGRQDFVPDWNNAQQVCPPTYMVYAILSTLLCCLPFGIVSIIYASQVSSKWNNGDIQGSYNSSNQAKNWATVSIVVGLVINFCTFVAALIQ